MKLEMLQRRRAELEGDPSSVNRCTEIIMPSSAGSFNNRQTNSAVDSGNDVAVPMDQEEGEEDVNSVLDPSMREMVAAKLRGGDDNTPLLTEAVRSLQKAQKQLVYSYTVIKIRLVGLL